MVREGRFSAWGKLTCKHTQLPYSPCSQWAVCPSACTAAAAAAAAKSGGLSDSQINSRQGLPELDSNSKIIPRYPHKLKSKFDLIFKMWSWTYGIYQLNVNVETRWKKWACEPGKSGYRFHPPPKMLHTPFNSSWCYIIIMKILGLKYGRVSQEIQLMKNLVAPPPPHSCTLPITAAAAAAAYASFSSRLRHKSMSSLFLPLTLPLLST